jgi:hypothetical protein
MQTTLFTRNADDLIYQKCTPSGLTEMLITGLLKMLTTGFTDNADNR